LKFSRWMRTNRVVRKTFAHDRYVFHVPEPGVGGEEERGKNRRGMLLEKWGGSQASRGCKLVRGRAEAHGGEKKERGTYGHIKKAQTNKK